MDQNGIQCIEAELSDRHTLHEPLDMVDVIYNLASPPPGVTVEEYARFNEHSLPNLLEEANEHGVKVFVHLSCLGVYGFGGKISAAQQANPEDPYQKAKLQSERIVTDFGRAKPDLKVRIVRAAPAIGPRDTGLTVPLMKMIDRGKVVLPSADETFSFSHPKDIAQALVRMATYTGDLDTVLVKSFDSTLGHYSRSLSEAMGARADFKSAGLFSGKSLLRPYANSVFRKGQTLVDQDSWKKISYAPSYTQHNTVDEIMGWYRKEPWVTKDQA
jgi:nucleoside-diphosphate-sugar epimerase